MAKQQLAQIISEHIRLALENLNLRQIIASQLIRDPLTGLFNRRYMEKYLEREFKICDRNGQPLSIIMLDLDRFKHFHDNFGHSASDGVLQELGMFLQENIRNFDMACRYGGDEFMLILPEVSLTDQLIACRYGGDEFMLILPEVSLDSAGHLAEQLRETIKHLRLQYGGHQVSSVTGAVGVACFPEHGLTGNAAISAARAALDRAKQEGRDRVVTASDIL
ncbi:MAG: GGDEF domain-containing protein [Hormoscilla sp.]